MAQRLRAPTALPEVLSSILSQHPYGGSEPSVVRSDALFCHAGKRADRTLYIINTS